MLIILEERRRSHKEVKLATIRMKNKKSAQGRYEGRWKCKACSNFQIVHKYKNVNVNTAVMHAAIVTNLNI